MERSAFSPAEFCASHGLARTTFYELLKQGRGPRLMKIGRRTLISQEAAAEWRRRLEEETATGAPVAKAGQLKA